MVSSNMMRVWLVVLTLTVWSTQYSSGVTNEGLSRPKFVNVGALLCFNSMIGRVAKVAIDAAVQDVNSDPAILKGTKLKIAMQDTKTSDFLGIVEAMRFMENDTVAIIGPEFSVTAHVISHIANELRVPLLSYAATDPTLAPLQFPFFVRTTRSDTFQMDAVAEIIGYYEWRDVVAIYVDDEFGRNGIGALGDKLAKKRCKISFKAPLSPNPTREEVTRLHMDRHSFEAMIKTSPGGWLRQITRLLIKVSYTESRILILHIYSSWGLQVLNEAKNLQMLETGYVWIATDWLSTILDTQPSLLSQNMDEIQGVLTLRMHTPASDHKTNFVSRWGNLTSGARGSNGNESFSLNTYGLYAYDSVRILASAIDSFFDRKGEFTFSNDSSLANLSAGLMHLDAMSVSDGGSLLLQSIARVNTTGLTGTLTFSRDMDLVDPSYEVINVIGTGIRSVGYWSNSSGLSVKPPQKLLGEKQRGNDRNSSQQRLYSVIWPGQTTQRPRGWVFPNNGKKLRIGVPKRVSYHEFVSQSEGSEAFTGYCIDVFTAAREELEYDVPYEFIPFGDGRKNPSNNELLRMIAIGAFDAVVGDITITTSRTKMVDFTQPYIESGLVVVAPIRKLNASAWAFLRPFTPMMWCVTGISFLIVGAVVWILERRTNEDFRGPPRKQVVTIMWFSFSTLFFSHKERTGSTLARFVLIIWLFVVLVLNSSYIASLTSILTVQQLSSPVKGIESLVTSGKPIGFLRGSFAENYLTDELNIHRSRLVPLNSQEDYAKALRAGPSGGGVAAVVDERAYMEVFLSTRCEFSIIGQEFTKMGWGFAFPRDSPLAIDMSTAILKLSEKGGLQRTHDKWLTRGACSSEGATRDVDRLEIKSFWGLFMLSGLACLLALLLYFIKMLRQFFRKQHGQNAQSVAGVRSFFSFVREREEAAMAERFSSKRRRTERVSNRIINSDCVIRV